MPALHLLSFGIQRSLLVCKMHVGHLAWVVQNGLNLLQSSASYERHHDTLAVVSLARSC